MDPLTIALTLAAKYAPDVIGYFTGSDKAAAVAGQVIGIAQTVTGTATPTAAAAALALDPVKAAEFAQACADRDADLQKAQMADTASARAMQVAALGQEDKFSKRFVYYFAAAWSLFAMLYFVVVTLVELPAAGQRVADTILGVLISTVLGGMFAFFYGSTKGSWEKTKLLAQSAGSK